MTISIKQVRDILGEDTSNCLEDKDIENTIALYRAMARLFINKSLKNKLRREDT